MPAARSPSTHPAVIQDVAASGGCAHATGTDGEDGGITVQLFPYDDTPNNGGVYKVWLTPDRRCWTAPRPGNKHCFVPRFSKTDNYKVRSNRIVEIDTTFAATARSLDGMAATWTDTLGASNVKFSEYRPEALAFHEAHVEAVEAGQPPDHGVRTGRVHDRVGHVTHGALLLPSNGSVTVPVSVKNLQAGDRTYFVRVTCQ